MLRFHVGNLAAALGDLMATWTALQDLDDGGDVDVVDEAALRLLVSILDRLEGPARLVGVDCSLTDQIKDLRSICAGTRSPEQMKFLARDRRPVVLATKVDTIANGLRRNLDAKMFMFIPSDQAEYYGRSALFGDQVKKGLPLAAIDVTAAGNAYAAGLWTACVFHSMRAAEHGLRSLAKRVRVKLTKNKKPCPVTFGTWQDLIDGIRVKITLERQKPNSESRARRIEWFSSMADQCEYMKDIWRNEVSHARRSYTQPEALAVLDRAREFSQRLVAGIPK